MSDDRLDGLASRRLSAADYNLWRKFRYRNDPEYREKVKAAARVTTPKRRAADPAEQARIARYERWVAIQGEQCAICGDGRRIQFPTDQKPRRLAIDHDHATGIERGLLCANCNRMLGGALDRPEVLEAGAAYLRRHAASHNANGEEPERE